MSNYFQEELNSESTQDNSYDSEEGHSLGISTLDYEKIDTEYQKNNNNKRSHEVTETSENTNTKKIKTNNIQDTNNINNNNIKEKCKEKDEDDDYLITCPICLEPFLNKTLLNPCYLSQKCPLCKQDYNFAIYNIKDEYTYDKIYFGEEKIQNQKQKRKEIYQRNYRNHFTASSSSNKDDISFRK
ncbi:hypothetical protein PIROE2DRAFT_5978 [Piromyces sp. E2]|nr:hypothetical protein PIROE2DRAFT_5978 [Piromyces sp. E2]|eukprot:OUM66765.1 hypothetical protein PIROE2DRAFT_5978 [Piromyces sp. E2]